MDKGITETYKNYEKFGDMYAPELKRQMIGLLESDPKEFISSFKEMSADKLCELFGVLYIEKIITSFFKKREMDTCFEFINTFELNKNNIIWKKLGICKLDEKQQVILTCNSSSGYTAYFSNAGKFEKMFSFEKNTDGSVTTKPISV